MPYEQLSVAKGVHYLRELGARYYLAQTPAAIAQARAVKGLQEVATVGGSVVFLVRDVQIVQPLGAEPVVITGVGSSAKKWQDAEVNWFGFANENLARFAASGPDSWQRVTDQQASPSLRRLPVVTVSNVHVTDDSIRFHVSQTGSPVLIRVSYFPWWHASGATGPYRATPNWMIVVPTSKDVVIGQRTQSMEWLGVVLTIVGALLAVLIALWAQIRRRAETPDQSPGSGPMPSSVNNDRTRAPISSRIGRTASSGRPAGSGTGQSS